MHLLLTDRLSCPRCGPAFGLILLAEGMRDRRVGHGELGCPNCRDSFPIRDGFADLRAPPRGALGSGLAGPPPDGVEGAEASEAAEVERLRALLGVVRGPGTLALVGAPARLAGGLAASVDDVEIAAVDADMAGWPEAEGVSRLAAEPGLPFHTGVLRGAAVDARLGEAGLAEAARVVAPRTRIVVERCGPEMTETVARLGLKVLAAEGETVVVTTG